MGWTGVYLLLPIGNEWLALNLKSRSMPWGNEGSFSNNFMGWEACR